MSKLRLSLACWNYDRTRRPAEGRIPVDGIELTYLNLPVERNFFRMFGTRSSMSRRCPCLPTCCRGSRRSPFIAIPVSRRDFFRHSCIYINRNSGIREPKDLIGKRIGTPEFQMTAGVWIRGILSDEYQFRLRASRTSMAARSSPALGEAETRSPSHDSSASDTRNKDSVAMLDAGESDALYTAGCPHLLAGSGSGSASSKTTGDREGVLSQDKIFPIMHTVVICRDVTTNIHGLAQSL